MLFPMEASVHMKALGNLTNGHALGATAMLEEEHANTGHIAQSDVTYASVNKHIQKIVASQKPLKLFIIRHGQRCDFGFKGWFERSFDKRGR